MDLHPQIRSAGGEVDKTLIDHHIAELDFQISRQLDAVMHHQEFQKVESLWARPEAAGGQHRLPPECENRNSGCVEEDLRQDFEDAPELIQRPLLAHLYRRIRYPGGEPIGSADLHPMNLTPARGRSMWCCYEHLKVSAAALPFIGSVGPKFFLKDSMEEVAVN
ncbi:type VI secretion system contractile sheath domain-containing protein [Enterobacter hormaechei]